jgi:hypothetical protein
MSRRFFLLRVLISVGLIATLISCGEKSGSGDLVPIPTISITCTSSNCKTGSAFPIVHLVITGTDCTTQAAFGAVAAAAYTVSCNGAGCTGTNNTGWENNGTTITKMVSGTYNICGVIDYSGQFDANGTPHSGDAAAEKDGFFFDATTGSITLTGWRNVP